jgi:hypothetical protein
LIRRDTKAEDFKMRTSMRLASTDALCRTRGCITGTTTAVFIKVWVDGTFDTVRDGFIAPRSHDCIILAVPFVKAPSKNASWNFHSFFEILKSIL